MPSCSFSVVRGGNLHTRPPAVFTTLPRATDTCVQVPPWAPTAITTQYNHLQVQPPKSHSSLPMYLQC